MGSSPSLGSEINIAKTSLSNIKRVEPIPTIKGDRPYPTNVNYIFSRLTATYQQQLQKLKLTNIPAVGSIGLFTAGLEPLTETFKQPGENVKDAVERLTATFQLLVASRILKTTLNANSSALDVELAVNLVEDLNQIIARITTAKGRTNRQQQNIYDRKLPVNKLFQFQVKNNEDIPVYLTILLVDSNGGIAVRTFSIWL